MKKIFIILMLILCLLGINNIIKNKELINYILNINNTSNEKFIYIYKEITKSITDVKTNNLLSILDMKIKPITLNNKKEEKITSPIIYIYNTHEDEKYFSKDNNLSVKDTSKILSEALLKYNIKSIVEEKSINQEIYKRNLSYKDTYKISKEYLDKAKEENKTIKYYIDIHRDSADGSVTKVKENNKDYATIMFILCTNHKNYKENEKNIKVIENYIKEKYPNILRKTYIQNKYVYNVDFSSDAYIIEIGGPDNNLEEITNTSIVLAEALNYYINNYHE